MTNAIYFLLGGQDFSGTIPSELGALTSMIGLYIEILPALTGSVPHELSILVRDFTLAKIELYNSSGLTGTRRSLCPKEPFLHFQVFCIGRGRN